VVSICARKSSEAGVLDRGEVGVSGVVDHDVGAGRKGVDRGADRAAQLGDR